VIEGEKGVALFWQRGRGEGNMDSRKDLNDTLVISQLGCGLGGDHGDSCGGERPTKKKGNRGKPGAFNQLFLSQVK